MNRRKRHTWGIMMVAACILCSGPVGAERGRKEYVEHSSVAEDGGPSETGKITMVFTGRKSEYSGMWVYLVFSEAFRRMGLELVFESFPASRCSFLADQGKVDGELSRMHSYNEAHPNLVRVEEPLTSIGWVAYSTDPTMALDGWESLRDTHEKVEFRHGLIEARSRLPGLVSGQNLTSVNRIIQGLRKLAAGRTDIYVDIEETVLPYLSSAEFEASGIRRVGVLGKEALHAFLHKKNASYAPRLASVLRKMKDEGLFERYIAVAESEVGATLGTERLLNGGFEETKDGFPKHWKPLGGNASLVLDDSIRVERDIAIRLQCPRSSGECVGIQQHIQVEAGKRFDFGGRIRVSHGGVKASIKLVFLDRGGNPIGSVVLPQVLASDQWVDRRTWVRSPNRADVAKIVCSVQGSGHAWFDDIHFTTKLRGGY